MSPNQPHIKLVHRIIDCTLKLHLNLKELHPNSQSEGLFFAPWETFENSRTGDGTQFSSFKSIAFVVVFPPRNPGIITEEYPVPDKLVGLSKWRMNYYKLRTMVSSS